MRVARGIVKQRSVARHDGKRMAALEERFFGFLRTLDDAEEIDKLPLTAEQSKAKKADYFLDDRRIICEVKSLRADMSAKIERILEPHQASPEWPRFYGTWPLDRVLLRLPNGVEIRREIIRAATSSIDNLYRDANRQIRETQRTFGLPGTAGMLVIVNDMITVLSPAIVATRIVELDRKQTVDGTKRFPHVDLTWVISDAHEVILGPEERGEPSTFISSRPKSDPVAVSAIDLHARWARWNGLSVSRSELDSLSELDEIVRRSVPEEAKVPRHELWRRQYRANPYLRLLDHDELLRRGAEVVFEAGTSFLKELPSVSAIERHRRIERFTHLIEELNFRGIDLREMQPLVQAAFAGAGLKPSNKRESVDER